MSEVFVVEAAQLDGDAADAIEDVPTAAVGWPDGRVDVLPHTCVDRDVYPSNILQGHPHMHLGYVNLLGGMTSGYDSEDLARLGPDVFYSRIGDATGGEWVAYYLRGEFLTVAQHWLAEIVPYVMIAPLPWDALILCTYYGLLAEIPPCKRHPGYESNLFCVTPDEELTGLIIDFEHSLPETEIVTLVMALEAAGCTWPRSVAEGNENATAAWRERIRDWSESCDLR